MSENVIRFPDVDRKSRNPDAVSPRDPADSAVIIILPQVISRPIYAVEVADRFHFIPGSQP
jgi:hypothetical protein